MSNRFDSVGLFWKDLPGDHGTRSRMMPDIPETGWRTPTEFPNLAAAKVICIDTETYDPELTRNGPGWARGKGHIVGVSVGVDGGGRWYFPMRHEVEPEYNIEPEKVLRWLRDTLGNPYQPKVGANLPYDLGWLAQEGVEVKGQLFDVEFAEALLTERDPMSLEVLGQKYLNMGKESNTLYQWCAAFYGGAPNGKQRANIYRSPARLVGPYAESDVDLPLRIIEKQYPLLDREGVLDLFHMECKLIPLLQAMRFAGVRVDVQAAEKLREVLTERIVEKQALLNKLAGFEVNINKSTDLVSAFEVVGLTPGRTRKGRPSFSRDVLESLHHPLIGYIQEIRRCDKLSGTFLKSYIIDSHIDGRVFCQFHPLRGTENGTRSGRFSSSTPNLQNIPARDDELAPLIRGAFLPDEGHLRWRKYDYSQIEYRFLIHYALGKGAEEARARFRKYPDTDYHDMALDLIAPEVGWDISTPELRKHHREPTKNINFGLIYAMGVKTLSHNLGLSVTEGKKLFAAYHRAVPFAKTTLGHYMKVAQQTGGIKTILGRKSRFDLWESSEWGRGDTEKAKALPYNQALRTYGRNIQRAYTYKGLNRLLQGSAAELMKVAMLRCWEDGVFDVTGVPRLTVHDELDFSDPGGRDEAFEEVKHIMETAIPLKIPVKVTAEVGPDWGHVK